VELAGAGLAAAASSARLVEDEDKEFPGTGEVDRGGEEGPDDGGLSFCLGEVWVCSMAAEEDAECIIFDRYIVFTTS